jgi:hypothetical protein
MPRLRAFLTKEKEKAGSKSSGPELLNPILEAESENVLYGARRDFLAPSERAIVMS